MRTARTSASSVESSDQQARYNGAPATGVAIYQLPGAIALDAANGVRKALAEMAPRLTEGPKYSGSQLIPRF